MNIFDKLKPCSVLRLMLYSVNVHLKVIARGKISSFLQNQFPIGVTEVTGDFVGVWVPILATAERPDKVYTKETFKELQTFIDMVALYAVYKSEVDMVVDILEEEVSDGVDMTLEL